MPKDAWSTLTMRLYAFILVLNYFSLMPLILLQDGSFRVKLFMYNLTNRGSTP